MNRRFVAVLAMALLAGAGYVGYGELASPTRVALVNYQDFTVSRTIKAVADDHRFRFSRLLLEELDQADQFDIVLIFGRGLALDPEQFASLEAADRAGSAVFIDNPTNPAHRQLITLTEAEQELARAYLDNGGDYNYRNFWFFARQQLDAKRWQAPEPKEPLLIDADVLFHLGDEVFASVADYQRYYEALPGYNADGDRIALITTVPGPFNANREHLNAMINALEAAGMRVYPINARAERLSMVAQIEPDAVLMMPHGRFGFGNAAAVEDWFNANNIPLLTPISVFTAYKEWLENPQGYAGGLLTLNVVLPELDGGIVPRVVNAQFPDEQGFSIFEAIPKRLDEYVAMVQRWIDLKKKANSNKKIGIVYFRGPGKNSLVAGGMEVTPSLYNTLRLLKQQGYDLGDFPGDYTTFRARLEREGPVLTPVGLGQVQAFLSEQNPAWVTAAQYQQWCVDKLESGMCSRVEEKYGAGLGDFMVQQSASGASQIAVSRIQFGNVVLMPQPLAGFGNDNFRMVHGTGEAPPQTYMAAYMWLRFGFAADAIIHFGTHGSLEFTAGKQVALSPHDWADALIGNTPHFYIYTMSNVGEAIIAKRRSYATILNHLTPPFQRAGLYSDLATLRRMLDSYRLADGQVRNEQRRRIIELATAMELHQDLNMDFDATANRDDEVLPELERYLGTLSQSRINKGLYTWGKPWPLEDAAETAELMLVDTVADSLPAAAGDAESLFSALNQGTAVNEIVADLGLDPTNELTALLSQHGKYRDLLLASNESQATALSNALAGGYVAPASGGDMLLNPEALPTGRNMYSIDAEQTPSPAAWEVGKAMADEMLADYQARHDRLPNKVSFTLWPSEFIHSQGATIAQVLYLLGVEPVYAPSGQVQVLELIPAAELGRPRIDVLVQSAGQLRDLAASRLALIDQAVTMAAAATDGDENFVRNGARLAEQHLLDQGLTPAQARELSTRRSFGGVNGSYGTRIMGMVEQGDSWQSDAEVADQYLLNMGAVYGNADDWGDYIPGLFAAALQNTDVVMQPRSSNTWGGLSLDHVYEFMGGLSLAVRSVTGEDAEAYFADFRNPNRATVQSLQTALQQEARTTLLNPVYLQGLIAGEASSAEVMAETLRNSFGWNAMKPAAIAPGFWNEVYETLIDDKHDLALQDFFETENPYALQEATGVILEAARKGFWTPDPAQLETLAALHADLVSRFEAGCGSFTCGNQLLQDYISAQLDASLQISYQDELNAAEVGTVESGAGVVLREQGLMSEERTPEVDLQPETRSMQMDSESDLNLGLGIAVLATGLLLLVIGTQLSRRQKAVAG